MFVFSIYNSPANLCNHRWCHFHLFYSDYHSNRNQGAVIFTFGRKTHSDVETQQVADDSRHSRQDDHSGDVVDQRVHGQTQQSEWSIQLLGEVRGNTALLKLGHIGNHTLRKGSKPAWQKKFNSATTRHKTIKLQYKTDSFSNSRYKAIKDDLRLKWHPV